MTVRHVTDPAASQAHAEACLAAAVFAVDPAGLGGVCLRAAAGSHRDAWLRRMSALLDAPARRLPLQADDERLQGGLDLVATLAAGTPVRRSGLLAECDGGVLLLPMAERCGVALAARLAAVLDTGRCGEAPARVAIVALDEGRDDDAPPPASLADRLAIHLALDHDRPTASADRPDRPAHDDTTAMADGRAAVLSARARLPRVRADEPVVEAIAAAAAALGIVGLRAPALALRVARTLAALDARERVDADDAERAARWVLAPRARCRPVPAQADADAATESTSDDSAVPPDEPPPAPGGHEPPPSAATEAAATPAGETGPGPADAPPADTLDAPASASAPSDAELAERVLEAALARLPADLLVRLAGGARDRRRTAGGGRRGQETRSSTHGRPVGCEPGDPRRGARLDLLATLRQAAPWQPLRRREAGGAEGLRLRREDLRVKRLAGRRETATIFAVDASGSSALHRLAEAKGAVERLLADCYVRRDQVALLAFRGRAAEVLLPPTRSLARVRRCLSALPGGGGTPLAAGLAAAQALADGLRRQGRQPGLVVLTDGKANIARDGSPGREAARRDALAAAQALRAAGIDALLLDTAPLPQAAAQELAEAMGARYLALPQAQAAGISRAVQAALHG